MFRLANSFRFITCLATLLIALPLMAQEEPPATPETPATTQAEAAEPVVEETPKGPQPIRPEDYAKWESLGFRTALSPNGTWLAYSVNRTDGENELRIRMLATDETKAVEYGSRPSFSKDSKWLAYSIGYSEEQREKMQKSKKPVQNKLGLRDLSTGETEEIDNVQSFSFSDDGAFLVMRRHKAKGQEHDGVNLVLRHLASGIDTSFGNVASYSFNDDGTLLAMIIDPADEVGRGVQVYDASNGALGTLDSGTTKYNTLTWREDAADLAVLRETAHEDDEDPTHVVIAWRDVDARVENRSEFDPREDEAFPEDFRIVDFASLNWSDDGEGLFFGIKEWDKKPAEKTDDDDDAEKDESEKPEKPDKDKTDDGGTSLRDSIKEASNVEVWHADDVNIIPRQKKTANRDKRENHLAAWWLDDGSFVRLGNDLTEKVALLEGQRRALGRDETPYLDEQKFGPTLSDVYVIDTTTGERVKILEANKFRFTGDPTGTSFLYVKDNNLHAYNLDTNEDTNLTGEIDTHFINQEISNLTDEKPPYGIAGWMEDGSSVILYDRYDLWQFALDGSESNRLTQGAEDRLRHRYVRLDNEEEEFIDPARPMILSLYGDTTKKSGYARMTIGQRPDTLVYENQSIGRLIKAEDSDVYAYVAQDFDDSPDIFVDGPDLDAMRQVTETNPFQKDYLWGTSELMTYTTANGEELQGSIYYPSNYEPGKQYPMMVYIYEMRSQTVHSYSTPTERHPYNPAVYTSQGYFWFQPDITYRPQNPGLSSVECVIPAVEAMIETGMIDKDKIGLVGHSWGAYQTAFIVTQTDLFAAGVAGAPLTNMMSMAGSIYWNSGQTDAHIFHESQGRMDKPFWRDVDTYIKNSPIFNIDAMNTPLMIAFGTDDGAVDFNQGVELYNAARLVDKTFVMLVYPGENHGLRVKENQVDYHYRVLEWFNHYVKGEEPAKWITDGVPHLERQKEIEAMKNGKK
ncbi:MAG: prolyl oligopeptidase family serine peptidase [Planctomycetota bacterium]|nr:prolyl oligopeptidase family serine peptidase [Planctomycetota bacterium]